MARLHRAVLPGHLHLVIQRSASGTPAFADTADRAVYLNALLGTAREFGVDIHAYALLSGEVRLLATPADPLGLAHLMQGVGRRYVRHVNRRHGRTGSPWEGRFRSAVVEAELHFLGCLRFVETAVSDASAAPQDDAPAVAFSSLDHHLGTRPDPRVVDHPAFWRLGNTPFEREAAYRRLLQQAQAPAELASILHAALNGWVLGSAAFAAHVGEITGRRPRPVAAGRPRRTPPSDG